MLVNT